jgi:hypothetical protein
MKEAKSFDDLKKDQLVAAAVYFGVDHKKSDTKSVIAAALAEDGVTFAEYKRLVAKDETTQPKDVVPDAALSQPVETPAVSGQLVKMTRNNASFQIRGHTFTRQHPYRVVGGVDLDYILEQVSGFRLATPSEVQSYYN